MRPTPEDQIEGFYPLEMIFIKDMVIVVIVRTDQKAYALGWHPEQEECQIPRSPKPW